ncbi:MAG TPA: hypothetical protein VFM54_24335 [Micromonosporaceae bacterium]|nr:hypothetical protein [Micromonosporaceae bacterium]
MRHVRGGRAGADRGFRRRPERRAYFRLALALGCTVRELLARIDSRELTEWLVYEQLYGPLGPDRDDQLAALVAATVANALRSRGPAQKVSAFVPRWSAEPEQDTREQLHVAAGLAAQLGGVFVRGGGFDDEGGERGGVDDR